MQPKNLSTRPWRDYELLDSGDGRKLERYGKYIVIRPETQALWRPARAATEWKKANAEFRFAEGKGAWVNKKAIAESWELGWGAAKFTVKLTSFKHMGVFPEQAANWEWIAERVMDSSRARKGQRASSVPIKVLNLFGYTGVASIVAALAGANVTHVDASRQSNEWAKENAKLSEVPAHPSQDAGSIRYIFDDALKFVEREVRRAVASGGANGGSGASGAAGAEYDGIILDPPAFGRGAKGEVWKIEEDLPRLLEATAKIASKKPGSFFLLNGYAAGYSPRSFLQATQSAFPDVATKIGAAEKAEFGELQIEESSAAATAGRAIPSGIYTRFVR
jgi:23S rRNA (cytosine1962-C5)-methyltransferase